MVALSDEQLRIERSMAWLLGFIAGAAHADKVRKAVYADEPIPEDPQNPYEEKECAA